MSRSYKSTPIVKQRSSSYRKFAKKQANKKVRQAKNMKNGNHYRKYYESRNIFDFSSYCTLEDYILIWKNQKNALKSRYIEIEDAVQGWRKSYYIK